MKGINRKFYLGAFIVLGILSIFILSAGFMAEVDTPHYLLLLPALIIFIIALVFHYRAWKAIQDGHASTSPGKAVVFLFIPVFNLYWLFRTLNGFARDLNVYIARHKVNASDLPEGLYLFQCILILVMLFLLRFESGRMVYPTIAVMVWVY